APNGGEASHVGGWAPIHEGYERACAAGCGEVSKVSYARRGVRRAGRLSVAGLGIGRGAALDGVVAHALGGVRARRGAGAPWGHSRPSIAALNGMIHCEGERPRRRVEYLVPERVGCDEWRRARDSTACSTRAGAALPQTPPTP